MRSERCEVKSAWPSPNQGVATPAFVGVLVWVAIGFFVLNVLALIAAVIVNSFATSWLGAWLPSGFTLRWYSTAWTEFQLDSVLTVTIEVFFAVVAISLLIGVPAAYALARRNFRFRTDLFDRGSG